MENVSWVCPTGKFPEKVENPKNPFSRLERSERNFMFHLHVSRGLVYTDSAAILVSHRVTGSAPYRRLRSNGTSFYLPENPFLFPPKFPDFLS